MRWRLTPTVIKQYARIRGLLDTDYPPTYAKAESELTAHCEAAKEPMPEKRPTLTKRYRSTVTHGEPWKLREKPHTVEMVVDPWKDPPEVIQVRAVEGPSARR
jgi:hypothetical protein